MSFMLAFAVAGACVGNFPTELVRRRTCTQRGTVVNIAGAVDQALSKRRYFAAAFPQPVHHLMIGCVSSSSTRPHVYSCAVFAGLVGKEER
eukprot:5401335-Amphidinium_carterae.1